MINITNQTQILIQIRSSPDILYTPYLENNQIWQSSDDAEIVEKLTQVSFENPDKIIIPAVIRTWTKTIEISECCVDNIDPGKSPLDLTGLTSAIQEATQLLDETEVSDDGLDVDMELWWATFEEHEKLYIAVNNAEAVILFITDDTMQEEIIEATYELLKAMTVFIDSRDKGLLP